LRPEIAVIGGADDLHFGRQSLGRGLAKFNQRIVDSESCDIRGIGLILGELAIIVGGFGFVAEAIHLRFVGEAPDKTILVGVLFFPTQLRS
jgi:hypothetical protein